MQKIFLFIIPVDSFSVFVLHNLVAEILNTLTLELKVKSQNGKSIKFTLEHQKRIFTKPFSWKFDISISGFRNFCESEINTILFNPF